MELGAKFAGLPSREAATTANRSILSLKGSTSQLFLHPPISFPCNLGKQNTMDK